MILPIPVENTPPSKGGTFVPSLGACDKLRNSESIPHATLGKKRAVFLFSMQDNLIRTDVTVIGGGLAGMASAIHLAKAGLEVVCIEPAMESGSVVGESLDWSAPELLRALGLPMERLLADEIATYKRHVTV